MNYLKQTFIKLLTYIQYTLFKAKNYINALTNVVVRLRHQLNGSNVGPISELGEQASRQTSDQATAAAAAAAQFPANLVMPALALPTQVVNETKSVITSPISDKNQQQQKEQQQQQPNVASKRPRRSTTAATTTLTVKSPQVSSEEIAATMGQVGASDQSNLLLIKQQHTMRGIKTISNLKQAKPTTIDSLVSTTHQPMSVSTNHQSSNLLPQPQSQSQQQPQQQYLLCTTHPSGIFVPASSQLNQAQMKSKKEILVQSDPQTGKYNNY